jgi:hypothetical protein
MSNLLLVVRDLDTAARIRWTHVRVEKFTGGCAVVVRFPSSQEEGCPR